jgi:hypothetical protein
VAGRGSRNAVVILWGNGRPIVPREVFSRLLCADNDADAFARDLRRCWPTMCVEMLRVMHWWAQFGDSRGYWRVCGVVGYSLVSLGRSPVGKDWSWS